MARRAEAYCRARPSNDGVLAAGLKRAGCDDRTGNFFDTLTVEAGDQQDAILQRAANDGINLRRGSDGRIGISCDETTTPEIVEAVWRAFAAARRW